MVRHPRSVDTPEPAAAEIEEDLPWTILQALQRHCHTCEALPGTACVRVDNRDTRRNGTVGQEARRPHVQRYDEDAASRPRHPHWAKSFYPHWVDWMPVREHKTMKVWLARNSEILRG